MASIERTAYPRFRREPTARALQEFYTPTEEEIGFAQSIIRSDEHLFCVAAQLKCFQQLGYFPDLAEVPSAVANHICLRLRLPAGVPLGYDQPRTMYRHHDAIREYLRIIPSHERRARRIAIGAIFESAKVMDNPTDLINVAVEQLRINNCELMGFPSLDRLVQRIRAMTHRRLFRGVMERLTLRGRERLDTLLKTTELVQRQSAFNNLKQLPKKPSLTHLETLLDHLEWLEFLGEIDGPLEGIPPALVTHFAAEAKTLNAGELKEYQEPRRHTLLLCLIHMMRVRTRDDVVKMFLKRMGRIHQRARQKLLEIQARQRQKTEHLAATLVAVLEIVPGEDDDSTKVAQMKRLLADRGGVEQLREDCQAIQAWSDNNYIPLLAAPYRVHRHVLFRLIRMLHLESANQDRSLMDALHIALQNKSRRSEWVAAEAIDLSFASARWHKVVFRRKDDQLQMHRRQFKICVFSHLAVDLRAGDVSVAGSEEFADYRHQMVRIREQVAGIEPESEPKSIQ